MAPELFARVSQALRTDFIAIPERELGSGITNRVKTVRAIRTGLNELGHYQAIHLLGTGNPLSVAIFAAAGADSFDGLEWCRTVADHESATLFHFPGLSYNAKVAFHNLEFFRFWTVDVQRHTAADNLASVLRAFLPRPFFSKLQMILPDLR
jgi:queuine/archaeosine tRNA-ribosyltransferase